MAKRLGDSEFSCKISKKQKLNDLEETLWEDDLDDNCFDEIANQLLEKDSTTQQAQENSFALSYESFKPNIQIASTQELSDLQNSFKKAQEITHCKDLKMELTYLKQKCESKEGEVSILRAQMKKIKSDMEAEQSKKQREHYEIVNLKDKEIKTIKGQLDFKDLEITNLKQRILEITKRKSSSLCKFEMMKNNIESKSKGIISNKSISKPTKDLEKGFITSILLETEFVKPTEEFTEFFNSSTPEILVIETKGNQFGRNTIPYLHNQILQDELTLPPGPELTFYIKNKKTSLEDFYGEVFSLFKCNITEINTEVKIIIIKKLLVSSMELLKNFLIYLEQLENVCRTEDIEQLDRIYLLRNSKDYFSEDEQICGIDCEIGVRTGRTVQAIAELLPYSEYLRNALFTNDENDETCSTHSQLEDFKNRDSYFVLINNVIRKIFSLRKTDVCSTFLNSVAILLVNLSRENLYNNIFPVFTSLIGSVLFTRPPGKVLHRILVVMKHCSTSKNFLDFLCRKPEFKKFTINKKINYFSEDTCKFTLFVFLLNNSLKNLDEEELPVDVAFNVLSFVDNIFMSNPSWVHDQRKDRCTCLEQLYQLIIEVLYWILMKFKKNEHYSKRNRFISIFKCGIRVFELLFFNSYDSIEKYIDTYSRYKEISDNLLELEEDLNSTKEEHYLEKISSLEEVASVSSSSFELI